LVKGIDRTDIGPNTHPAIGTGLLVYFNVNPSRNFLVSVKGLNPSHGAIVETLFACDTFILICLHTNLLTGSGLRFC
jgi:hypothetical protein